MLTEVKTNRKIIAELRQQVQELEELIVVIDGEEFERVLTHVG